MTCSINGVARARRAPARRMVRGRWCGFEAQPVHDRRGGRAGPPACVWESDRPEHRYSGRTLAVVGDEAWFRGGFGGTIYALGGRTCQGWGIDLCNTVWC